MKASQSFIIALLILSWVAGSSCLLYAQEGLGIGARLPVTGQQVFEIGQNQQVAVEDLLGAKGTIFIFWSNQCAWTRRYEDRLNAIASASNPEGVHVILVNSNNKKVFPRERDEESRQWERSHEAFFYLSDEGAGIAKQFGALRTPQVFAFDASYRLVYKGAIDDSPGDPEQVSDNYVDQVIRFLDGGPALSEQETKAFGCQIRY